MSKVSHKLILDLLFSFLLILFYIKFIGASLFFNLADILNVFYLLGYYLSFIFNIFYLICKVLFDLFCILTFMNHFVNY